MVEESVIKKVKKFVDILKRKGIRIDKIILYGSYVRGNPRGESDIDVAVISRDFGKDRTEEGMTLFRIAGDVDPRIEPIPISLKSYEEDTWLPLIYEIRTKGVEIKGY
ncbi:MAG: nucleotidyltransferase domain-containing protein [Candidatus Edwardsbacteria bacterium]